MQVIQPTFVSALSGTQFSGLISKGLYDPYANIVASILYARNRYGSLANAYRGVAYDEGGWLMPQSQPVNLLAKPEPVLSPDQWRIADEAISRASTSGNQFIWHVEQQPGQSAAQLAREMDRLLTFEGVLT
jgi:SLT domain-containing protein